VSVAAGLLKQFGFTHVGLPNSALVPGVRPATVGDFKDMGEVANPDIFAKYDGYMRRPESYQSMLETWEEMSMWDLVAAAACEIVSEALQPDESCPGLLWYECNDSAEEDKLNDMLDRCEVEEKLPSQVHYLATLGNHFEKLDYELGVGVQNMTFAHPLNVRRYWLERNRRCIGFKWDQLAPTGKDNAFELKVGDTKRTIPRVGIGAGTEIKDLWYPWDFMHFRRMYRMRVSEHGESMFNEAQGIYKKLRMAIDQMTIHRAQVQPDRYVANIDTQEQPPSEQMKTVQKWKQSMRSRLSFGQQEGDATDFKSFYNPLALDTIIWIARPKGFAHSLEKLAGTANVPDVYDIELLTNLFFSIIGMPQSWLGLGQKDGKAPSGKALLATDMRFLRKVKAIRNPLVERYEWLGYFDAMLRGKDPADLEIRVKMTPIGSLEDQLKLEMLNLQGEALAKMAEVMKEYKLPRTAWIDVLFKRYLHLPDDVVNLFLTALPEESEPRVESMRGAMNGGTKAMLAEIDRKFSPEDVRLLQAGLEALQEGKRPRTRRRGKRYDVSRTLGIENIAEPMLLTASTEQPQTVISSYGADAYQSIMENKIDTNNAPRQGRFRDDVYVTEDVATPAPTTATQVLSAAQAARDWM
jgi:Bacteriophage T4-like portal protein (Gp20)